MGNLENEENFIRRHLWCHLVGWWEGWACLFVFPLASNPSRTDTFTPLPPNLCSPPHCSYAHIFHKLNPQKAGDKQQPDIAAGAGQRSRWKLLKQMRVGFLSSLLLLFLPPPPTPPPPSIATAQRRRRKEHIPEWAGQSSAAEAIVLKKKCWEGEESYDVQRSPHTATPQRSPHAYRSKWPS